MAPYIVRRLFQLIPVLFGVSIIVFLMLHMTPGDPADLIAGMEATDEDVANIREALRLDDPLHVQYLEFVKRVFVGDFGISFRTQRPVIEEISYRYGNTLLLGAVAICFALVLGLISGIVSAVKSHSIFDNVAMLVSLLGVSMPTFFLGFILIMVFSLGLGWLPMGGKESWQSVILPAVALGASTMAIISRMMRSSLMDVLDKDYVRTARAKGVRERGVIFVHALRNAMIPVVTVTGLEFGYMLGGAVIVESVFAWPGIGRLIVQSILARDFPVVQASVLMLAVTFVAVNLITDLMYGLFNPKIRQK